MKNREYEDVVVWLDHDRPQFWAKDPEDGKPAFSTDPWSDDIEEAYGFADLDAANNFAAEKRLTDCWTGARIGARRLTAKLYDTEPLEPLGTVADVVRRAADLILGHDGCQDARSRLFGYVVGFDGSTVRLDALDSDASTCHDDLRANVAHAVTRMEELDEEQAGRLLINLGVRSAVPGPDTTVLLPFHSAVHLRLASGDTAGSYGANREVYVGLIRALNDNGPIDLTALDGDLAVHWSAPVAMWLADELRQAETHDDRQLAFRLAPAARGAVLRCLDTALGL